MTHSFRRLQFLRYPVNLNSSLKAWNASDEHLIKVLDLQKNTLSNILISNDRFGFISTCLADYQPTIICHLQSQIQAIRSNLALNKKPFEPRFNFPLDTLSPSHDIALVRIPKSLDLFQLYLYQVSTSIKPDGIVLAAFMTRHFSPQLLEIAGLYFGEVLQSRAWKKSRILQLRQPKKLIEQPDFTHRVLFQNKVIQQYYGVFSAKHIDYATQFLIQHLRSPEVGDCVLDLASGNGILAAALQKKQAKCTLHLLDDSFLAIASSKINVETKNCYFHQQSDLSIFEEKKFDWVISNPPFHFEHDIDLSIPLKLFREVHRCLALNGQFMLVYNRHLNYQKHLKVYFSEISIVAQNNKFIILLCKR